ncbi:uncharacterized protein LOC108234696 [Kryptolebias marmoratus]|uniref:uncharacterized protein LOC108234696 n=1 Tax=Kryptolebias marmoratus TaxID=37003 RepID=UPI0007F8B951|nr:uncharacterized protein LOC108234696 [Kryptolebias marmoratus]
MAAVASNIQHSYGLDPRGPNPKLGADLTKGPHQAAPPPSGPPRPEEQHHKPFFYIQPQQPYLPMQSLQWPVALPMPVSYNPYYSYPGLGYSLPMMPHYQPNPYMEPPGFVVPHTHLHLMDYRRVLNPQYYQTMAYHARRFRYQHNSSAKEMTSCEVQTEPLESAHRTSTQSSHKNSDASSTPAGQLLSSAVAVQNEGRSSALQEKVPPTAATRTPSNGSFVIQTEEVRIECCATPVGLQLLRAHEDAEMSRSFPQDMVQCSSLLQSLQDEGLHLPADQSEQELQVCPDILLVGKLSTSEKILPLEEPGNCTNPLTKNASLGSQEVPCVKAEDARNNFGIAPKNFHLKDIHLPFDPKYLDELRKMESAVWSAEEALISSPELLIQNSFVKSNNTHTATAEAKAPEILVLKEEAPIEEIVHVIEMIPLVEDDMDPLVETMEGEMVSEGDICLATEDSPMSELTNSAEVMLDDSPLKADGDQQKQETNDEDNQDTSFESLPAYLPSTSWLSDFDHNYYCTKMPPAPRRQDRPLSSRGSSAPKRRRKLDTDYKEQPCIRKPKERYKPKGKVDRQSFSDHECCLGRNFNENLLSTYLSSKERLCSRCMAKRRICTSPSSECDGQSLKRKAVPFQQWNEPLLPTCDACRSHNRRLRKDFNPDLCGPRQRCDTEGESSGNSSCRTTPKWRAANDSVKLAALKKPLTSRQNVNRPPAVTHPKLTEKNCACSDLQHQPVAWERLRHCPHGNTIREIDENCTGPVALKNKWRNVDRMYLMPGWQNEKSWRDVMPGTDGGRSKSEATSQHVINHKKPQPQSQGTCTKDTRC